MCLHKSDWMMNGHSVPVSLQSGSERKNINEKNSHVSWHLEKKQNYYKWCKHDLMYLYMKSNAFVRLTHLGFYSHNSMWQFTAHTVLRTLAYNMIGNKDLKIFKYCEIITYISWGTNFRRFCSLHKPWISVSMKIGYN